MNLAVISFTQAGNRINECLVRRLGELGEMCDGYVLERFLNPYHKEAGLFPLQSSLGEWAGKQFGSRDGIIFVGAAGIAVRALAPFLRDKMTDPAVVVVDEQGRYAISLLSGHIGGANRLAELAAGILGAVPVITTATDLNGQFAVDVFAEDRALYISDRVAAKEISADVLEGNPVGFYSDFPVEGPLPDGFTQEIICRRALWITYKSLVDEISVPNRYLTKDTTVLRLIPKVLSVGIGCRKGMEETAVEAAVMRVFEEYQLDFHAVAGVSSIDLKKEEPGLLKFCEKWNLDFTTCDGADLEQIPGDFTESEFVRETTGTGSVCERAAVWDAIMRSGSSQETIMRSGSNQEAVMRSGSSQEAIIHSRSNQEAVMRSGSDQDTIMHSHFIQDTDAHVRLLVKKQVWEGVTVAVALRDFKIRMNGTRPSNQTRILPD